MDVSIENTMRCQLAKVQDSYQDLLKYWRKLIKLNRTSCQTSISLSPTFSRLKDCEAMMMMGLLALG